MLPVRLGTMHVFVCLIESAEHSFIHYIDADQRNTMSGDPLKSTN